MNNTAGGDSIPARGVRSFNLILNSGRKAVPMTPNSVLVVPGRRCEHLRLKAWDCSGDRFVAGQDDVIALLDRKLN